MYNSDLKEKFINTFAKTQTDKDKCLMVFRETEKYELELGIDLYHMNFDQLESSLRNVGGVKKGYNMVILCFLKNYLKWCSDQGLEVFDVDVLKLNIGEDNARRSLVANPYHLQCLLNAMFEPEDYESNDCVIRSAIWLSYSGIKPQDICCVTKEDVDISKMLIHFNNKDYPIYRESLKCLSFCKEATQFNYYHPNYHTKIKPRVDGKELLCSTKTILTGHSLATAIVKKRMAALDKGNSIDVNITMEHVWISGIYHRSREIEIATGISPDFVWLAEETRSGKEYSYCCSYYF